MSSQDYQLPNTPIAICGMGVRLPGGIRSASDLFHFLANKGDARNEVPADRYNVEAFHDPAGKPGSVVTKYGYYLSDIDLAQFDASMFDISNAELAAMDPSQRLLLEVTREAFESAGEADFRGKNIGTFVGDFTEDWQDLQHVDLLSAVPYQLTGKGDFALSNRLSYVYDLTGPSVTVKTACSSTAEAIHEATLAIRSGQCPSAVVAGANIIITPRMSIGMTSVGLLAPDGNSKAFDASANGFARGESVCALYLKRLDHAIRDGNPVRAVVRACGSNADGGDGSRTFGTPNPITQAKLIRQTYEKAGLPLGDTKVVELHGTGTLVGDPLETAAIADCFGGDETVYIGSVKPNLGHGEGGSAMASIIKCVVALENKTVLPNVKFDKPNPKIPWHRNLKVPVEPLAWPTGVHERMSINSFGLGGSNVHIVIDSAESMGIPSKRVLALTNGETNDTANGHGTHTEEDTVVNGNGIGNSNGHTNGHDAHDAPPTSNGHSSTNGTTNGNDASRTEDTAAGNLHATNGHSTNGTANGHDAHIQKDVITNGHASTNGHLTNGHETSNEKTSDLTTSIGNAVSNGVSAINGLLTSTTKATGNSTRNGHASTNGTTNGYVNGHTTTDTKPNHALLLLSATTPQSLTRLSESYQAYLTAHPDHLEAMVYTLATRREHLRLASYSIASRTTSTLTPPSAPTPRGSSRSVSFVFTGQGAQWLGMGREMLLENTAFAASIRAMDVVLKELEHAPAWTLEETLLADGEQDQELLSTTDRSQPICTAVQVAYVDALAAWGVTPSAVVGHSSGEIAGAYAASVLTLREAIVTAYYRGYGCARNKHAGGMAAVGLGREQVEPHLRAGVVVACENSAASVTISGDLTALEGTMADLKKEYPDAFVRQLRVPMAYHSEHMRDVADLYGDLIAPHLAPKTPKVPFYSTVYGRRVDEAKVFGADYWKLNMVSPVLFRTGAGKMVSDLAGAAAAHLEIGPHSALAGPLRQIYKEVGITASYASVAERGQDAARVFLESLGKLYTFGITPVPPFLEEAFTLPDLPTYPWHYEGRHWAETRVMQAYRFRKYRKHELLGLRILESSDVEPSWRNVLRVGDVAWLSDHRVESDIVFPGAGYVAMAGAAVAQIAGGPQASAYTVQDVHISAALLLHDDKGTEVVTTLKKRNLTASKESKFWEFSIASESGGTWTKHCWGLVASGCNVALPREPDVAPFNRVVDAKRWYTTMARIGLHYSNRFVGLDDIRASPVAQVAVATVKDDQAAGEEYALHPSTLDLVFQSWSVALAKGEHHQLDKLFLPTFIGEFYVGADGNQSSLRVRTASKGKIGAAVGSSYGLVDGDKDKVAFVLNGFETSRMEAGSFGQSGPELKHMSIQWHPAFDFVAPEALLRPSGDVTANVIFGEQFGVLAAAEVHQQASTVETLAQPHFKHFVDGVAKHMDQIDNSLSKIPDAQKLKALSRQDRLAKMLEMREQSKGGPVEAMVEAQYRVAINTKDMLEGRKFLIDVLLEGGVLQKVYDEANSWSDIKDFFRVLGLNKPQVRVLEIGAGTGSTTAIVLEAMHSAEGERLYEDYTITDVSAGFVNQTKERFAQYGALKYAVCDITVDPMEQGFEPASYDLIIASNVLHATPNLVETLTRCRSLLKPDGHIFMQEFCSDTRYADLIMGCFEGWWAGVDDGRVERPVIQEEAWDVKLRQSGFQGIKSAVRDNAHPHFFLTSNILARVKADDVADNTSPQASNTRLTLLKPSTDLSDFGQAVKTTLEAEGYAIDEHVWGQQPLPEDQGIVSLMDVDPTLPPLLADIDPQDLTSFIDLMSDLAPGQALLWLMRPAQTQCSNPHYGQMPGVARCVRAELAIDLVTLELDTLEGDEATKVVARVLAKVQQTTPGNEDSLDIESEYVWRKGQVLVSRMHTTSVEQALVAAAPPADARHLVIGQPGMLQTMRWVGHDLPPLTPDDVQIRVKATGMNFHDVAVAMGIVGPDGDMEKDGYHGLGSEGTAIVTAIGANVKHVAVGDRVVFMEISTSCFATEKQLPSDLVARAPDGLSDEDAAGLWTPYCTVLWSYLEKAHLKRGQSVLIHSAAGGVGIAAIHLARWMGAEFYCTVGSQDKIDFLTSVHGVPKERIFHSRDDSFVDDVMRATNGRGVDLVLNSLSGELLHASWKCVARGGSMVDLGKRDFLGRGRLEMLPFVGNRAFFGVDLAYMIVNQKHLLVPYLQQAIDLFQKGEILPLHPTTVFEADRVQDAFRYMQKGVHKGRIVVRMPEDPASLPLTLPAPKPSFSADAIYMVAGGLGGLGRSILGWMATHGARHLVVISPSAGTRVEHHQFVVELAELGCELQCFAGDVADADFMRSVVELVSSSPNGRPVKGVLQLAMQLRDTGFVNMDHDVWSTVTSPKVKGTMNLHELLPKDLDFFIMCGSTSGTLGAYGQANYAAANAYLDAFLHFRHGLGLPATALDIAAIGDVGYVACNKNVAERLGRAVTRFMTEGEFLTCLQLAVERSQTKYIASIQPTPTVAFQEASQIVLYNDTVLPLSDPRNTTSWRRDPRLSVFRNNQGAAAQGTGTGSEGLRSFLGSLTTEPERLDEPETPAFLAEEIAKRIFSFLMKEDAVIDLSQTLNAMGADSLVAIEIRNWWKQTLGIDITVLELGESSSTMEHLGELAVARLKEKFAGK